MKKAAEFRKNLNKKFLETDYPRGRAIKVIRRFHFGLGDQKTSRKLSGLYFASPGTAKKQFRPLRRKGKSETLSADRELFRLKDHFLKDLSPSNKS